LKIFSDLMARDPERIARFEREARTLAPNASATVVVVQNWLDELKRLVP
jgi:hypothetical protein